MNQMNCLFAKEAVLSYLVGDKQVVPFIKAADLRCISENSYTELLCEVRNDSKKALESALKELFVVVSVKESTIDGLDDHPNSALVDRVQKTDQATAIENHLTLVTKSMEFAPLGVEKVIFYSQ